METGEKGRATYVLERQGKGSKEKGEKSWPPVNQDPAILTAGGSGDICGSLRVFGRGGKRSEERAVADV